ncbi:hypothetical protein JX266_012340 [Neoarthrinium moseri]|nr:hypothetical protein JX266_012340 [Neoarthrinium moseri]
MFTLPDNPYEILGVSKNAQVPEIRSAHRKLVLKCHPDKVADPAQKAAKQEEFQKVQKAYEMLSNESERQKYDDMVRANEMEKENAERRRQRDREFTPGRTPPRYDSDYARSPHYTVHVKDSGSFTVRTAEPKPGFVKSSTFPATHGSKSPYTSTRTPPRSFEDNINYSSYEEAPRDSRRSRKTSVVYDEKSSSRQDDERRRRKKEKEDEEWDRAQEKAARRKEQEKMERRERERKDEERREKERKKEEKRRVEKVRDQDRKRDGEEKRSRHKTPYVEEDEPVILNVAPPPSKSDKKSKSSSRVKETVREVREVPAASARDVKHSQTLEFAAQYLDRSRSKVAPGLARAQTYHYNVRGASPPPPPAVATPPPAAQNVAPPPPGPLPKQFYEEEDDEPIRRSSARRRMSHDTPRTVKEKTSSSSHKKSSSTREPEYVPEPSRPVPSFKKSATMPTSYQQGTPPSVPESPPRVSRSHTEQYPRPGPGPMPTMTRAQTWMPGDVDDPRERSRSRHARAFVEEDSEEEPPPRRSRRHRSPDEIPRGGGQPSTFRYTVANGKTVRSSGYREESPTGRKSNKHYYMPPEANTGRPMAYRPAMPSHDSYGGSNRFFSTVKTAPAYTPDDVAYGEVPHAAYRDPVFSHG